MRGEELEDLAMQAADDALIAVLSKLDDYRGLSRFTTWAYKFALLEAGVKLRRRAWQGREVVLEPEAWPSFEQHGATSHEIVEHSEVLTALRDAIATSLTPHQRRVFVAANAGAMRPGKFRQCRRRTALSAVVHGRSEPSSGPDNSARKRSLLELLVRNAGIVLDRTTIYQRIWGYEFGSDSKNLAVYIGYLRRKLEKAGATELIHTVRGVGYSVRSA